MNLYKHSFCHFTMDLFSTRKNCAEDHINLRRDKNKKPRRGEVFCSVFYGWWPQAHCITSTKKVYAIGEEGAIFTTVFADLEYGSRMQICPKNVAVGIPVTGYPPHRSRRARFTHRAPASGVWR
ncbi:MAG: hypothetical protein E6Y57_19150, partial [Klebsiella oxytoca]|nr:hypothetical protein [Klebsiella oxytoca]MDU6019845.1 hypothetical protein [Klebsiella oxytoca]MDU6026652.1 hypothetical protein [Klebsiella oxytoca]